MKPITFLALAAVLIFAAPVQLQSQTNARPAFQRRPPQPADIAAPKLGPDGQPDKRFMQDHSNFVSVAKSGNVDLLFLGDSITAGWRGQKQLWNKAFGAYKPANFGIGGDRTQHVLWRISNGELDGIIPKAVVLMIGTNNSGSDPAEDIAKGITKIVETIHAKSANSKVLLLAIFPRGPKAEGNRQRDKINEVNKIISKLDDGKKVLYLDIGDKFLQPDRSISREIMPDYLHLTPQGYQIWADAITPKLAELMK